MKLQGVQDGTVFATDGWDLFVREAGDRFAHRGRLPRPGWDRNGRRTHVLTAGHWRAVTERVVGAVPTVNCWPLTSTDLLATVGDRVAVSGDAGRHWTVTHRLPEDSGPMGVLPSAVAHVDGTTYLGEYPLATDATPRVLTSQDRGRTWTTAVSLPTVRHVHAVQADPYSGDLWVTTGDTDAAARIGRLRDGRLDVVGSGSQSWRAVELAFTPSAVLWGMDCSYAEANHIYRLSRDELGVDDPSPDRVHEVPGSVYYSATLDVDDTTVAVFSTAMEAGRDRTGPASQSATEAPGVVVAATARSAFTDWRTIASYRRRRCLGDTLSRLLPRANAYVFLATDGDRLLVNPYNTTAGPEPIRSIQPETVVRSAGPIA